MNLSRPISPPEEEQALPAKRPRTDAQQPSPPQQQLPPPLPQPHDSSAVPQPIAQALPALAALSMQNPEHDSCHWHEHMPDEVSGVAA